MNPLKVFGAGASVWSEFVVKYWKKILLGIIIVPIALALFFTLILTAVISFYKFVFWMASFSQFNDFCNKHGLGIAYGMLGFVVIFTLVYSLYQDGKRRLTQKQNDSV